MTALFEMHIRIGGDPRGFGEFIVLRDELAKLSHPARPDVDWVKVEQCCLTLFQHNGAELQTAAAFALARSQRQGLEGMEQGVTLIEALCGEWLSVWPPQASMRLDILAWLFAQLQLLLRRLDMRTQTRPALEVLDRELERLGAQLERQGQPPLVTLQALRHQISGLIQRLTRNVATGETLALSTSAPGRAYAMPLVILSTHRMPQVAAVALSSRKRRIGLWLLVLAATIVLAGGLGWWSQMIDRNAPPPQAELAPVRLDSLSLFDAGSTELKPDSTKVLIKALANIKAQPGWLIVIVGHTDTTGDPEQNLQLSYARASAVRNWMQRMGDIPDSCFAVQGAAGSQPIASNDTASGRAVNRRVDIRLVPQIEACTRPSTGSSM
jgi:type VI secretion system protein VasL